MTKSLLLFKNYFIIAKWLPLALAVSLVFVPNSLVLLKLLGLLFSIFLFYRSVSIRAHYYGRGLK